VSTLKKFDLNGKHTGDVKVAEKIVNAEAHGQMIKDYIVALRANARQWSANTKGRSEVNHTTKKPHPQKGGGRARQGSLVAPQYRGGGRVFAPKPKFDQHVKINKKERQAAIRFLIAEKLREGHLHIVDNFTMDAPSTKFVSEYLKSQNLSGRVLFLGEGHYIKLQLEDTEATFSISGDTHDVFVKSVRNIPKTSFLLAKNVSGYDLLVAKHIVVTSGALDEINQWLS
jgi:large subunit ribosomal protein L4